MFCNVYIRVLYTLYTLSQIVFSTINRCYNNLHISITDEIIKFIVKLSGDQFKYSTKTTIINQLNSKIFFVSNIFSAGIYLFVQDDKLFMDSSIVTSVNEQPHSTDVYSFYFNTNTWSWCACINTHHTTYECIRAPDKISDKLCCNFIIKRIQLLNRFFYQQDSELVGLCDTYHMYHRPGQDFLCSPRHLHKFIKHFLLVEQPVFLLLHRHLRHQDHPPLYHRFDQSVANICRPLPSSWLLPPEGSDHLLLLPSKIPLLQNQYNMINL